MGVVRLEFTRREPVLGGAPFKRVDGAGSAYEKLEGVLHFSADPAARQNDRQRHDQRRSRQADLVEKRERRPRVQEVHGTFPRGWDYPPRRGPHRGRPARSSTE